MKKIPIYQIDAFAGSVFTGNPAAVIILDEWLDDKSIHKIGGCAKLYMSGEIYLNE